MKTTLRGLALAGMAVFGSAGAAQAAPVVADFTGSVLLTEKLILDLGNGLQVSVEALGNPGGPGGDAPFPEDVITIFGDVHRNGEGIGARLESSAGGNDLDGFDDAERLQFTFNQPVTLLSVVFENVDPNDEQQNGDDQFDMAVDDVDIDVLALLGTEDLILLPDGDGTGGDSHLADFTGAGLTGTVFDFYTTDVNDDYRIRQFLVEAVGEGADVPAPPALMLLGLGLAGLGFAGRYRR